MATIAGIFKTTDAAENTQRDLNHRGIAKTQIDTEQIAGGGVRLTAYVPDALTEEVINILGQGGAANIQITGQGAPR